jgi:hypothetical protein
LGQGSIHPHILGTVRNIILAEYEDAVTQQKISERVAAQQLHPIPDDAHDELKVWQCLELMKLPGQYGNEVLIVGYVGAGGACVNVHDTLGGRLSYVPGPFLAPGLLEIDVMRYGDSRELCHFLNLEVCLSSLISLVSVSFGGTDGHSCPPLTSCDRSRQTRPPLPSPVQCLLSSSSPASLWKRRRSRC